MHAWLLLPEIAEVLEANVLFMAGEKQCEISFIWACFLQLKRETLRSCMSRLTAKGKAFKVKAVAIMRKIILLANTLVVKGEFYKEMV